MKNHLRIASATMAIGALSVVTGCLDEPKPRCNIARGEFAATYTLISATPPDGDCAQLKGEGLWLGGYNAPNADQTPNYDATSIAIEPDSIVEPIYAGASDSDPTHVLYAFGAFTTPEPDDNNLCHVPTLAPKAELVSDLVPGGPMADPNDPTGVAMCQGSDTPAQDLHYEFSDVVVYMTSAAIGTQFSAQLKFTSGSCTAVYKVQAVYPAVGCYGPDESATTDDAGTGEASTEAGASDEGGAEAGTAEGGGSAEAGAADGGTAEAGTTEAGATEAGASDAGASSDDAATSADGGGDAGSGDDSGGGAALLPCVYPPTVPDPTLCSPYADPDKMRATGSGLNPDFAIKCDPEVGMCVLAKDFPSFN